MSDSAGGRLSASAEWHASASTKKHVRCATICAIGYTVGEMTRPMVTTTAIENSQSSNRRGTTRRSANAITNVSR